MTDAAVTSKGQITIPVEIREALNIAPGDRVVFTILADGTTVFRAKARSLKSLAGSLKSPRRRAVAVDEMRIGRK